MSAYRVEAPHFVAGIETAIRNGHEEVVKAAPVLRWAIGKTMSDFLRYALKKGWAVDAN